MTTQPEFQSSFKTAPANDAENISEKFSFRTMQDDLLAQQNKSAIQEEPLSEKANAPIPQTPQPFSQAELPQKKISSFPLQLNAEEEPVHFSEVEVAKKSPVTKDLAYKLILSMITMLIVGILGLGGYYFWTTRTAEQLSPAQITPGEDPIVIAPPVEKYSQKNPNFLVIDIATSSSSDIKNTITSVASELKEITPQVPYEFIVVDNNNNPITFKSFAAATSLTLSPALLSTLGENFSLFIYNDNNNGRVGLSIPALEAATLTTELQKQEKTFATDLSFLFLDAAPEIKNGAFATTEYNNTVLHYFNLSPRGDLSVDYAVFNSQLIISTSKNTARALLDKFSSASLSEKNIPISNSDEACAGFADKLASCTPFVCSAKHPLTDEQMKKEITGVIDGKCNYSEQLPNNGKMECNYSIDTQKRVADYVREFNLKGDASLNTASDKANPIQEAIEDGQCVLFGY